MFSTLMVVISLLVNVVVAAYAVWQAYLARRSALAAQQQAGMAAVQTAIAQEQATVAKQQASIAEAQLKLLQSGQQLDLKRPARELAVHLLLEWNRQLDRQTSAARRFTESLSADDARKLFKSHEFSVENSPSNNELLSICVASQPGLEFAIDEKNIVINSAASSAIRWYVISYLNLLETTFLAAHTKAANRIMIMGQFEFLLAPNEFGKQVVANFRDAAGGDKHYPAIAIAVRKYNEKHGPDIGLQPLHAAR